MGKAIYAIDAFRDDAQVWRIDWIGGVAYNASVPSEPLIDVCLARLPKGETNPRSARPRSSETKFVAKIGVGLLPFSSSQSQIIWEIQSHLIWNLTERESLSKRETPSIRQESTAAKCRAARGADSPL